MSDLITTRDRSYPPLLHEIPNRPKRLFYSGCQLDAAAHYLAIVGTRRPSIYGKEMAREFSMALARADFTIVSGLAYGIDAIAHEATLDAGGRTIAVLGSGLEYIGPPCNINLAKRIMKQGTIITEYEHNRKAEKYFFPQRNRIIAGMSQATLIIEAPQKSGALITAHLALEYNRDTFALPGNITQLTSEGTNRLIRDGNALAVTSVNDIFEYMALKNPAEKSKKNNPHLQHLSDLEQKIYELIEASPRSIDELCVESTLPVSAINTTISLLELKGLVTTAGSHIFVTR